MAETCIITHPQRGAYVATWTGLIDGETGDAADVRADCVTRSIQISGTPGATLTVSIEGSNDGVNWGILNDIDGNALTFDQTDLAATVIKAILENTLYVRPSEVQGDGATVLKVVLVAS